MIHGVIAVDRNGDIVVNETLHQNGQKVNKDAMLAFAKNVVEVQGNIAQTVGDLKFIGGPLGRGAVILYADEYDWEEELMNRLMDVIGEFGNVVNYGADYDKFIAALPSITTIHLKVCIIGYGGVGKTTLVTLLNGGVPPLEYNPTVAIDIENLKEVQFGGYKVALWDFAGQDRFFKLWELYLHGAQGVVVVTDSTLENVLNTKQGIVDWILAKNHKISIIGIANKQDISGALSPSLVQRVLGIDTVGLTAVDPRERIHAINVIISVLKARPHVG
jgi:small GTP-binding protein